MIVVHLSNDRLQKGDTRRGKQYFWTRICVHAKFLEWNSGKISSNKSASSKWKRDLANMCRFVFIIGISVAHIRRWVWEIWITCIGHAPRCLIQSNGNIQVDKKMPNNGNASGVILSATDKLHISTFYGIICNVQMLEKAMRRWKVHKEIADRFFCLTYVPNATQQGTNFQLPVSERYSQTC